MVEAKDENAKNVKTEKLPKLNKKYAKGIIGKLKQVNEKFTDEKSKKSLFEESSEGSIFLQVTMKKIPAKKLKTKVKVHLPHSLVTDTTEVCLITGDLEKNNKKAEIEPTVLHYKELLQEHGVTGITAVVPLRQLRTEYKTYESRRQLVAAYDKFISDKKITNCLPLILGKKFFEQRKFPIQIDLNTKNLKDQVGKALSQTMFDITCRGNSCATEVARLSMEDGEILENIQSCIKSLSENLPGKWENVNGLYIKTARSEALPIYMSYENPNDVKLKVPRYHENVKAEELSTTIRNSVVKVFKDGKIIVKDLPDSGDEDSEEEKTTVTKSKNKKNAEDQDLEDEDDVKPTVGSNDEGEETAIESDVKRKRKKRKSKKSLEVALCNEVEDSVNEVDVKPKRKRKAKELVECLSLNDGDKEEVSVPEPDMKPVNKKRKTKESVREMSDNAIESSINEEVTKPKNKRKAKQVVIDSTENEDNKSKNKKRKNKELVKNTSEDEVCINEDVKPKNKRKSKGLDKNNTSINDGIEKDSTNDADVKLTRNARNYTAVKPKVQKRKTNK